jgi:hypothetical protein
MITWIKKEPALTAALVSLIGVVLGIWIENPELVAAHVGVIAALLGVRQAVVPVAKLPEVVTQVVQDLGPETVGVVGNVTKAGRETIERVLFPGRVPHQSGK